MPMSRVAICGRYIDVVPKSLFSHPFSHMEYRHHEIDPYFLQLQEWGKNRPAFTFHHPVMSDGSPATIREETRGNICYRKRTICTTMCRCGVVSWFYSVKFIRITGACSSSDRVTEFTRVACCTHGPSGFYEGGKPVRVRKSYPRRTQSFPVREVNAIHVGLQPEFRCLRACRRSQHQEMASMFMAFHLKELFTYGIKFSQKWADITSATAVTGVKLRGFPPCGSMPRSTTSELCSTFSNIKGVISLSNEPYHVYLGKGYCQSILNRSQEWISCNP